LRREAGLPELPPRRGVPAVVGGRGDLHPLHQPPRPAPQPEPRTAQLLSSRRLVPRIRGPLGLDSSLLRSVASLLHSVSPESRRAANVVDASGGTRQRNIDNCIAQQNSGGRRNRFLRPPPV